tara:strand:- start:1472 stop:4300 length:2829 start_codon:yes stop_codon:yes gene_type:complete
MPKLTDEQLFGTTSAQQNIKLVPEEEIKLAKTLVEGEGSNIVGGFMAGLQGADWANLGRIAKANMSSETLKKYSWFFNSGWKGDVIGTDEVEEGWNWMSVQEQIGATDDEWDVMPIDERISRIKTSSVETVNKHFNVNPDSPAYVLSSLAGTVASPSLIFTMAKPIQVAAYAGADAALYGMGDTGEVNPYLVAGSVVAGGTLSKGIQLFTKAKSDKILNALENEMNILAAKTDKLNSGTAILTQAKKNLGLTDEVVTKAINARVKKYKDNWRSSVDGSYETGMLKIPTKQQAIKTLEDASFKQVVTKGSTTKLGKGLDYIIEPISEGIKRISPRVYGLLKQAERGMFQDSHNYALMVDPFLKKAFKTNALSKTQKDKLWLDMSNAKSKKDVAAITKFLQGSGKKGNALVKDWNLYRKAMDDIFDQRVASGNTKLKRIEGYSPRKIISSQRWYAGAKASERSAIDKILTDVYKVKPSEATEATLEKAISRYFKSSDTKNIKIAGSEKARVKETLSEAQIKAYQNPWAATHKYIKESMEEVQRYEVFGRKNIAIDGDVDVTISNYVAKLLKDKKINGNDVDSLKELLTARFINGPKQMNDLLKSTKDLGYMTLLGHPSNAIRQFGDLAAATYVNGIRNATKGIVSTLNRGRMLTPKQMGLLDNVAEEFASDTAIRRGVDKVFKYSGFRSVDALGKGALLNSSIHKAIQQIKAPKGRIKFMNEWSSILGAEDAAKAIDDFKAFKAGTINKPTPLMKDIAFMKLSKIQPITLSELPKGYLNNPNGRMMYMLQSFTLKHVNIIRQDAFKEMAKGTPAGIAKGIKNFGKLGAYYTAMNVGADLMIDAMLGRDKKIDETIITNLYRSTGFLTKYDVDQMLRDGDIYEGWLSGTVMPPLQQMSKGALEAGQVALNLSQGKKWDSDMKKAGQDMWQNIPIIGRLMANWLYD